MATWLPSKTMLTNKGLLMLSEVQSGRGSLNITRAEIGSSFSQLAQLPDLLTIPTPAYSTLISSKIVGTDGSTLSIVVTNKDLTTGFNMCQIGIYATHPNVNAGQEILYFISQSESPADFMPSNAENIVQLVYDVYLRHDRISNPTINVISNYVPIATHSSLGVVIVGDTLSITEEGVLNAKGLGIPVSVDQPPLDKGQMWFEITA